MKPHLHADQVDPVAVRPLTLEAGRAAGHRLLLLSIEDWGSWADLRFGRLATPGAAPLARRIPLAADWQLWIDGEAAEVLDVAGRGDRAFSNGEVRFRPAPAAGSRMRLRAVLAPGAAVEIDFEVPGT